MEIFCISSWYCHTSPSIDQYAWIYYVIHIIAQLITILTAPCIKIVWPPSFWICIIQDKHKIQYKTSVNILMPALSPNFPRRGYYESIYYWSCFRWSYILLPKFPRGILINFFPSFLKYFIKILKKIQIFITKLVTIISLTSRNKH